MEFHRIVVGLELGHLSDQAVARAMSLAREFGARVDVVHGAGVEAPGLGAARQAFFAEHASRVMTQAHEAARGKLELLVEDPVYAGKPLDEYLHVRRSRGAEALLEFAVETKADLVVIGSHRHRKILDFGGTGRSVLARSPCPVWFEPAEAQRFQRVVTAIDLSPSSTPVLEVARSLATRFDVPVRVLHVFAPPDFAYDPMGAPAGTPHAVIDSLRDSERAATRAMVSEFDWGPLPVETELAEGEPSEEIVARAGPTDLVVMGTHGHTGVARAVLGSCAYRVLKHARGPILVVPQRG